VLPTSAPPHLRGRKKGGKCTQAGPPMQRPAAKKRARCPASWSATPEIASRGTIFRHFLTCGLTDCPLIMSACSRKVRWIP
jgi:hypothetical protein